MLKYFFIGTGIVTIIGLEFLNLCISISNHSKIKKLMDNQERFNALVERLNNTTNDIAQDYKKFLEESRRGQISEESFAKAEANIARLESLGASVENPVPVEEGTATSTEETATNTTENTETNQ